MLLSRATIVLKACALKQQKKAATAAEDQAGESKKKKKRKAFKKKNGFKNECQRERERDGQSEPSTFRDDLWGGGESLGYCL
mgnify:CR=1 FL=1